MISDMRSTLPALLQIAGKGAIGRLLMLSLVCALAEGTGFVLLVPLLAHLTGDPITLPFGLALPDMPVAAVLAGFVLAVTARALAEVARRLSAQDVQAHLVDGLRLRATSAVLAARWQWLSRQERSASEAMLISMMDRAGYAVDLLANLVRLMLALLALGAAALAISPTASVTLGAGAVLILLAFLPSVRRARRLGEALTRANTQLYARIGETLDSVRITKSFGREARSTRAIADSLTELRHKERLFVHDTAMAQALLQVAGAALAALLAWFALGTLGMTIALLVPLAAIFVRALPLVGQLVSHAQSWSHASPAIGDALTLIEEAERQVEPALPTAFPAVRLMTELTLDDVHIAYDGHRPALTGASLRIKACQLTVLTGPSGSGKSTLADVAAGLLAPERGTLAIDGRVLDEAERRAWRQRAAYVPQDTVLVSGSVRDNLLWARPDATEAQLATALEHASASFVHALPGGLDCDLGEAARALSGGERQRIALARALLREPDLIVLDEATSALDAESEQAIAAALHQLSTRMTVLAIAHRGILPDIADRVVRLDRGRIAAD